MGSGERRLMKAMMCEANRKEDRMCGKQMERRQPPGKGHNAQPLRPAQCLCLKWLETPGLSGREGHVPPLSPASPLPPSLAGRVFAAGCCWRASRVLPRLLLSHPFWSRTWALLWAHGLDGMDLPDLLLRPGRLGRRMEQPNTLHCGPRLPRLPFCFDKCYTSYSSLLISVACQMLQLNRKSCSWTFFCASCLPKQSSGFLLCVSAWDKGKFRGLGLSAAQSHQEKDSGDGYFSSHCLFAAEEGG